MANPLIYIAICFGSILVLTRMIKKGVYNEDTRSLMNFLFLVAGVAAILTIMLAVADLMKMI